jgi:hypothetical protein
MPRFSKLSLPLIFYKVVDILRISDEVKLFPMRFQVCHLDEYEDVCLLGCCAV